MNIIKSLIYLLILLTPIGVYSEISLSDIDETKLKGNFNVIIYGNSFINDPETFIILDNQEDTITISPYSSSFKYKILQSINKEKSLQIIKDIFSSSAVSFIRYREIKEADRTLGFEIKPVYYPWIFGISEPLETTYKKNGNKIDVFIRLNPRVEKQIYNGGNTDRDF